MSELPDLLKPQYQAELLQAFVNSEKKDREEDEEDDDKKDGDLVPELKKRMTNLSARPSVGTVARKMQVA